GRGRVRRRRRVRPVRPGALRTADAAAPAELARPAARPWRPPARRPPVRAAHRHQLDGLRRPARLHLLRLVRLRLPHRREGDGPGDVLAKAEKLGARVVSEAFVNRVTYDAARGRVTGVRYL